MQLDDVGAVAGKMTPGRKPELVDQTLELRFQAAVAGDDQMDLCVFCGALGKRGDQQIETFLTFEASDGADDEPVWFEAESLSRLRAARRVSHERLRID